MWWGKVLAVLTLSSAERLAKFCRLLQNFLTCLVILCCHYVGVWGKLFFKWREINCCPFKISNVHITSHWSTPLGCYTRSKTLGSLRRFGADLGCWSLAEVGAQPHTPVPCVKWELFIINNLLEPSPDHPCESGSRGKHTWFAVYIIIVVIIVIIIIIFWQIYVFSVKIIILYYQYLIASLNCWEII